MTLSDENIRSLYDKESYRELWAKALKAVESEEASFTLPTGDVRTAADLSGLLGAFDRPKPARRKLSPHSRTRVTVEELDARLLRGKAALGLRDLLEVITGKPVLSVGERRDVFAEEMSRVELDGWPWIDTWLDHCQSPRRVDSAVVRQTARQCAEVLSRLELHPDRAPRDHRPLRGIAESWTGDPKGLGSRTTTSGLVLRALALAHDRAVPTSTYERWLLWRRAGAITDDKSPWDIFISYAHEDDEFASPLAAALARAGLRVWFDQYTMLAGDSILEALDLGIRQSQAGLLVMSRHSVDKYWTRIERGALHAVASVQGTTLIPVLHGMPLDEFTTRLPTLAESVAIPSGLDVDVVVDRVLRAISGTPAGPPR